MNNITKNRLMKLFVAIVYLLLISAIVFFAGSCNKITVEPLTMYIIDEGQNDSYHYTQRNKKINSREMLVPVLSESVGWYFRFEDDHIYDHTVKDGGDINKLFGLTSTKIHENSARIGWRYIGNEQFEVFAYWYDRGNRGFELIDTLELYQNTYYEVNVKKKRFYFQAGDKSFTLNGTKNIVSALSFPWFGGNNTAPHKMYFKIVKRDE